MQDVLVHAEGSIDAIVEIPGSKRMTKKALMIAALADGVSELSGIFIDDEIKTMINALMQLGIVTQLDDQNKSCIIAGGNGKFPKKQTTVWCGNDPQLALLLLSTCANTPGVFYFDGQPPVRNHSFSALINLLRLHQAQFVPNDVEHLPITLIGADNLDGGDIFLKTPLEVELACAFLLIAPFARSNVNFILNLAIQHQAIENTCAIMADFGVLVHRIHQGQFMVPVPQQYHARDYAIEPDLTLAIYFFGAAALTGGEITISSLMRNDSKQKDRKFLTTLEKMGCKITENKKGLTLKGPQTLKGAEANMLDFEDTFLVLTILGAFATTPTRLFRIGEISEREIDRMHSIKKILSKMGAHIETTKDSLTIFPSQLKAIPIDNESDPKILMALYLLCLKIKNISIQNKSNIKKMYPDFFNSWQKIVKTAKITF